MRRLLLAHLAMLSLVPVSALAGTTATSQRPWTHFGLRPLGMGNAYVSIADDFNSLFYNPAGLARLEAWDGEFLNPALDFTKSISDLASDAQDLTGSDSVKQSIQLLEKNTGESHHIGLKWTPHLIFQNFGFGLGADFGMTLLVHREISPYLDVGVEAILPISFAMNFFEDRLSVGVSLKGRVRVGVEREFSMDDLEAFQDQDEDTQTTELKDYLLSGAGAGADVGILFTPVETMKPTLGISVTDFGGTAYQEVDAGELGSTPDLVLPSVNVGMSFRPVEIGRWYLLASVDAHSINQPYTYGKKLNFGSEIGFGRWAKFQAGLYQGYLTGGLQLDIGVLNLRVVTYATELGNTAGFKESRRYAAQLKLLL